MHMATRLDIYFNLEPTNFINGCGIDLNTTNVYGVNMSSEGKITVSARVDPELLIWLDDQVDKQRFRTRSHALEYALRILKQSETTKETSTA